MFRHKQRPRSFNSFTIAPRGKRHCMVEKNVSYRGSDVNRGRQDKRPNVKECRDLCRSKNAKYFDWVSTEHPDMRQHNSCWCKTSNGGRIAAPGIIAGVTNCEGA